MKLQQIIDSIEAFAPLSLQESYDNSGLQIGNPHTDVSAALLCLDVTEETMAEALDRGCELIISHHPLLFHGLKHLTGATPVERIAATAVRLGIAVYSGHTSLDSAYNGVSYDMAHRLGLRDLRPLVPTAPGERTGLGVVGETQPTPALEFLRRVKETFSVKALRYSADSSTLVVRRVALCGGAGAGFIPDAIDAGADIYITGDVKYHDYTTYADRILLADAGHYQTEIGALDIFTRILHESFPELEIHVTAQKNPVSVI